MVLSAVAIALAPADSAFLAATSAAALALDLREDLGGGLLRLAHGLEMVAEETEGHLHEVAGVAELVDGLGEHDVRLLGNALVRLHVQARGAAADAGEDRSLGEPSAREGWGRGVSARDSSATRDGRDERCAARRARAGRGAGPRIVPAGAGEATMRIEPA